MQLVHYVEKIYEAFTTKRKRLVIMENTITPVVRKQEIIFSVV